ncbi:major facilitator superfamily domain-containing protein [Mrakia frigida]|uniref:major facilitator superfamily domain-containing protein n=1 Tax=Mrakia frigida TaxID=29902 RepID=UPI003FCBFC7D
MGFDDKIIARQEVVLGSSPTPSFDDDKLHSEDSSLRSSLDQTKRKQTWLGYLWDTADASPEERKLLLKLDASLLVLTSFGYFVKNLDQTNIQNAFLSGMKEDLGMYGNQLTTATSLWTAGYVIGQMPVLLTLTRVSPRYIIPTIELGWSICTLATYAVKDIPTLYALRFLVGFFESGFFPAAHYILGSYYGKKELAKRACIFYVSGVLGGMFSGFIQTGASKGLNGVNGLEGWRWTFIIDAVISFAVAILGYIFFPGLPGKNTKPTFWLTASDLELTRQRMKVAGRAEPSPWTRSKVKALFSSWHLYVLPLMYILFNNAPVQQPMGFWLKSFNPTATHKAPVPGHTYSVSQINLLPLPGQAIFVVVALFFAWTSDGVLKGRRWPWIVVGCAGNVLWNAIILNTSLYDSIKLRTALYWLLPSAGSIGMLTMTWINEICAADSEKRAIVIGLANTLTYTVQAIVPNFLWKQTDMPLAHKGHIYSMSLSAGLIIWTGVVFYLARRDAGKGSREQRSSEEFGEVAPIEETK